mmetsp:Transcript_47037/g.102362  ORF Transcript_47037/g.102362 Transcript_47037/m.102362 type:complete len:180 (-) Transcript_47037:2-541(-)
MDNRTQTRRLSDVCGGQLLGNLRRHGSLRHHAKVRVRTKANPEGSAAVPSSSSAASLEAASKPGNCQCQPATQSRKLAAILSLLIGELRQRRNRFICGSGDGVANGFKGLWHTRREGCRQSPDGCNRHSCCGQAEANKAASVFTVSAWRAHPVSDGNGQHLLLPALLDCWTARLLDCLT